MRSFHEWKRVIKIEKYKKNRNYLNKQSDYVNEQNPTHKRTEAVNVNKYFLLKQLTDGDEAP